MGVLARTALQMRGRTIAEGSHLSSVEGRVDAPHQTIIKAIGKTRSRTGVFAMADYIARLRKEDRNHGVYGSVEIFDEGGNVINPDDVRSHVKSEFNLLSDLDNLSPLARSLGEDAIYLREKERLMRNQAIHLTWSLPHREGFLEEDVASLKEALMGLLDEYFGQHGIKILCGIHTEHTEEKGGQRRVEPKHPHAHILIGCRTGYNGKVVIDRDWLDSFKADAVRYGRMAGLNIVFERREDREDLRNKILRGEEPLRNYKKKTDYIRRGDLSERVPEWFLLYGLDYEKRRRAMQEQRLQAKKLVMDRGLTMKEAYHEILPKPKKKDKGLLGRLIGGNKRLEESLLGVYREIKNSFVQPDKAIEAYHRMAVEGAYQAEERVIYPNKALADWYMRKQPAVYGDLTIEAFGHNRSIPLKRALMEAELPPAAEARSKAPDPEKVQAIRYEAEVLRRRAEIERAKELIAKDFDRIGDQTERHLGREYRANLIREIAQDVREARLPDMATLEEIMFQPVAIETVKDGQQSLADDGRGIRRPQPPPRKGWER